jgi:hypothetical protein
LIAYYETTAKKSEKISSNPFVVVAHALYARWHTTLMISLEASWPICNEFMSNEPGHLNDRA